MLTIEGCRARQERFRARLAAARLEAAVITDPRDVYYLTGLLPASFPVCLYLPAAGDSLLICHTDAGEVAVADRLTYETNTLYTLNPDPLARLAGVLEQRLAGMAHVSRLGWQAESLPRRLGDLFAAALRPDAWAPVDAILGDLQQRKDPDEIALLRRANAINLAAYAAAEQAIAPGVSELEVLAAAHRAATLAAGEPIQLGGDYRSGAFGGPARARTIEAGELYIIDSGVCYRGYWSDLARTFAVGEPTALQRSVYAHVAAVLTELPDQIRPGRDGSDLWRWMDARLREHPHLAERGLVTHGGHGIGTRVHEMPDVNRDRGGVLATGAVITCEPGGYSDELRAGIRLENAFLITEQGVENLSPYPLALA
jgi:Xaa-Pro aminopeptidase